MHRGRTTRSSAISVYFRPPVAAFLVLLLFLASTAVWAESPRNRPNTLISVHLVELSNKNTPIKRTYREIRTTYRLYREDTNETRKIRQGKRASLIFLEPGTYCFHSTNYAQLEHIRVQNPLCFTVVDEGITNAGTWILGLRIGRPHIYARLVDMKENYSELESIKSVSGTTPAIYTLPKENQATSD